MSADQWIAASVYLGDGRILRYGPDEADAENQITSFSFDTSNPGGFGSASLTVPRPFGPSEWENYQNLFCRVVVYGAQGTIYDGYISGTPQSGPYEVNLNLSGWVTVLDRYETFREIFVDRDVSRWTDISRDLRIAQLATFNSIGGPTAETDTASALPALTLTTPATEVNPGMLAAYDAGAGNQVASIYYDITSLSLATYTGNVGVMSDDKATAVQQSADFLTGVNSAASGTFTPTVSYRYGLITFFLLGTVGAKDQSMTVRRLAVFGNHGLTKRGTAPDEGYFGSDVIAYAISQAPALTYSSDSIETTSFVIPHLTFTDDTSLRNVIEQVTALGGNQNVPNDWGVYEDKQFYWRSPGTYGRSWRVRRDQVASSASDGADADRRVAGIKINYTDGAGTNLSVGPPGSNSDYETTSLLDTDLDNPAYRIPGAFKSESVGITTQQGAINIGTLILNERNRLDWRGSIEIQGEAEDQNGNVYPASLIRAGDRIVISDSGDPTERTIVSTSYDHSSLTCSASIGAPPDSLESLLGQLAAVTDLIAS